MKVLKVLLALLTTLAVALTAALLLVQDKKDVYKRQLCPHHQRVPELRRGAAQVRPDAGLAGRPVSQRAEPHPVYARPVSYTHLDVYKRQPNIMEDTGICYGTH